MRISSFVLIGWVWFACNDGSKPVVALSSVEGTAAPAVQSSGKALALAESPAISLIENRELLHVYRDGLAILFAGEGFLQYVQEYAQPWGVALTGGRVLNKRSAVLYFPWQDSGAATLRVWLQGSAPGQRIEFRVNGAAYTRSVPEGLSTVDIALPAGNLKLGENRLGLLVSKAGVASGQKTYGLWHAIEIVGGTPPADRPMPAAPVVREQGKRVLQADRVEMWVEIPERAHFETFLPLPRTTAQTIRVRTKSGALEKLFEVGAAGGTGWQHQIISLQKYAGQLVAIQLSGDNEQASWGEPRIAVEQTAARPRPPRYENAILVVVDAMRSDRLTLYGKTRVQTPRMTALAKERGAVFLYNQAASPSSPPSHGSIQTGMIPRVHGVVGDKGQIFPGNPTISTQLEDAGVATGYYGNNPFGMARLKTPGRWTAFHQPTQEGKGSDCGTLTKMMLDFAAEQHRAGKRFFISSLPYEPHTPYLYWTGITDKYYQGAWNPPIGKVVDGDVLDKLNSGSLQLSEDEWQRMRALYDGEVEKMDGCFGQLMDGLQTLGVFDQTLVVLTSDHGEGMYEHKKMGHAWGHNAELANVPLVLYGKGIEARTIPVVTSHINIVPTVLDLLGVKVSPKVQGQSLVPLLERPADWTPRVVSLEYGRSFSLRARGWRYIVDYNGVESLFDIESDPGETRDLIKENGFGLRYMRDLCGFFLAHRSAWLEASWGTLNNHGPGFHAGVAR